MINLFSSFVLHKINQSRLRKLWYPRKFGVLEKLFFERNNGASSRCTQQVAVSLFAREKLTLLAQKAQRAHRAIVRATNRPTGGKDAGCLLATAILPIICAFKQLHGNPVVLPASVRTTDLIHPGAIERYYYFGAVAGTSGRRFEECNHWLGCFLLGTRMRAVGKLWCAVNYVLVFFKYISTLVPNLRKLRICRIL